MIDKPLRENATLPVDQQREVVMPARLCPYCHVVSNFDRIGPRGAEPIPDADETQVVSLDKCQNCKCLVYYRASEDTGDEVFDQYPRNVEKAAEELPEDIRKAFDEALICYGAGAPNGSLLMCRRALQEAMKDKEAKKGDLPTQLDDLIAKGEIIPRLRDWADQARIGGRLAAHGAGGDDWGDPDKIWGTMEDAESVIEYLKGFFQFLYVLDARMAGQAKNQPQPEAQSETDSSAE